MNTPVAPVKESPMAVLNQVIMKGDLSKLTEDEKMYYYKQVCDSLKLNALTRPFDYLTLNGKLTLYARKDCTEQLRRINAISIRVISKEVIDDAFVVTVEASTPDGRVDSDMGATTIVGLKGDAKINAMLKAITKAKRRVTLSISGLGLPDESELETIPRDEGALTGTLTAKQAYGSTKLMKAKFEEIAKNINGAISDDELTLIFNDYKLDFANFKAIDETLYDNLCSLGENRSRLIRDDAESQEVTVEEREMNEQMNRAIGG
jgi:hypothetical protein